MQSSLIELKKSSPSLNNRVLSNPDSVIQALIQSRNEIRKFRRNLIVADKNCAPMLLVAVFQTCFERALNGIPTRGEDLKRMFNVFFGPPARD